MLIDADISMIACEVFLSPQDLGVENHGNKHLDKGVGLVLFCGKKKKTKIRLGLNSDEKSRLNTQMKYKQSVNMPVSYDEFCVFNVVDDQQDRAWDLGAEA